MAAGKDGKGAEFAVTPRATELTGPKSGIKDCPARISWVGRELSINSFYYLVLSNLLFKKSYLF